MMIAENFVTKFNEFKQRGDFDNDKNVLYLVISHGKLVLHYGNMHDQLTPGDTTYGFPNPMND